MGFPSVGGDQCWSGLKSFIAKEEKSGFTLIKTLFILKRKNSLRDFSVFDSEYDHYRDEDRKYVLRLPQYPSCYVTRR